MISTPPFGSVIAHELPPKATELHEVPQSSADFRPEGPVPETLADLLPLADRKSYKRWKKTFEHIAEWKGVYIPLRELFLSSSMDSFRPFLRTGGGKLGYLENTIVHHRKGLGYLRNLAASYGVQVEPIYKETWRAVMAVSEANYCLAMAEPLEAEFGSPADVTLEKVEELAGQMVSGRQKRWAGARKVKSTFLAVMRECGFDLQPVTTARKEDYIALIHELPQPLQSQIITLDSWMRSGSKSDNRWSNGWRKQESNIQKRVRARRDKTTDRTIADICRMFGYLRKFDPDGEEGIDSLETLFQMGIVCAYASWLEDIRLLNPGSVRTTFSGMFAALRYFPQAKVDLSWSIDFMAALPEYSRNDRNARKLPRMVPLSTLDKLPDFLREERNKLIARHNRAVEAAMLNRRPRSGSDSMNSTVIKLNKTRATRLTRISVVAQQELIVDWLVTLVWRNENLIGLRLENDGDRPANLLHIAAGQIVGADLDEWVIELQTTAPETLVWVVDFPAEETKAGRPVRAVLPRPLGAKLDKFVAPNSYRDILRCGNDTAYLFLNQWGNRMKAQQLEEAVEEATALYAGRAVNPHLFRDIYSLAFLKAHNGDFLTLSKILWHKNHLVTVMEYGWMYDESVGTNVAAKWSAERRSGRKQSEAARTNVLAPQNWTGTAAKWREARKGGKS
jgi:hypothetical protein